MKKTIYVILLAISGLLIGISPVSAEERTSAVSLKSTADSTIFRGRIENAEYQVYIVMDFYKRNIVCPRQEIFGENPGYFGAVRDTRKWIIEDAKVSKRKAYLVIINDYGSEDLEATLTYNGDGTYTLERTEGSTMKIVVNRKWVKLPKKLVFKRK